MSVLREQIDGARAEIRRLEESGKFAEAGDREQYLRGLLAAHIALGGADLGCVHPLHKTTGVDEATGRTIWVCAECGEPA